METEETEVVKKKKSHKKGWLIVGLVFLFLAAGAGIYLYSSYMRKTTSNPIEAVPADAMLMVQVNDYDAFTAAAAKCDSYLGDLVSLGALDGMKYFLTQFVGTDLKSAPMALSAHDVSGKPALLLSVRTTQKDFDNLLKVLEINSKNFHSYKNFHIYEIGTHHRTFTFCFHHGLFSVSENEAVLKSSLDCVLALKSLATEKSFQPLREMMDKNPKQNWLVIPHTAFLHHLQTILSPDAENVFSFLKNNADWSAYQMTVSSGEIILSGYSTLKKDSFLQRWESQDAGSPVAFEGILPANLTDYACINISDAQTFASASSVPPAAKSALSALKTAEIHAFTLSDTVSCRYFAVRVNPDSAFLQSLLPAGHRLDSTSLCGSYDFGRGNFAPALLPTSCETNVFLVDGNCLIFSDSVANLQKYKLALKNAHALTENQLYLNLRSDGRWTSRACFQWFFQNTDGVAARYLSPALASKKSNLLRTKCVLYNCLKPANGLIPNNLYVKFAGE